MYVPDRIDIAKRIWSIQAIQTPGSVSFLNGPQLKPLKRSSIPQENALMLAATYLVSPQLVFQRQLINLKQLD